MEHLGNGVVLDGQTVHVITGRRSNDQGLESTQAILEAARQYDEDPFDPAISCLEAFCQLVGNLGIDQERAANFAQVAIASYPNWGQSLEDEQAAA